MIRFFFFFLCLFFFVYANEEPKNEVELEATMISLFKNYQYPYMVEYFEQYVSKVKKDVTFQHLLVLTLYVPDKDLKKKMFDILLGIASKHPKVKDDFYLEYGKFNYLNKDWKEAVKYFEMSSHPMSYYYNAWSYHNLGQDDISMGLLTKAKDKLKDKKWSYYFSRLNELEVRILISEKKYNEAVRSVKKFDEGPKKYMLLNMIYEKQGFQKAKAKGAKEILLNRYNSVEEVKSYLKNN